MSRFFEEVIQLDNVRTRFERGEDGYLVEEGDNVYFFEFGAFDYFDGVFLLGGIFVRGYSDCGEGSFTELGVDCIIVWKGREVE